MVDAFMPDVVVEIAFDSGYTTPAASRTWTDVSAYVELHAGIEVNVGRQDERSDADANQLTLTLDNRDGRFTALRTGSPYYPNVKVGRPIRVRVTPPGGSTVTRFTGFVNEWPVEWDGSDAYAKATITASSRMSRLGLSAKLKAPIEHEILGPAPIAYYTLGDPSGSTSASDSSGFGRGPMTQDLISDLYPPVVFGNAIGVASDGLTAAQFPASASSWSAQLPSVTVRSMRICFLRDASATAFSLIAAISPTSSLTLSSRGSGDSYAIRSLETGLTSTGTTAGDLHDVVVTSSAADGERIYVDGVQVATGAGSDFTAVNTLRLGGSNSDGGSSRCHVALYDVILTPTQIALQAEAALTGFAGDTTDERALRLLAWAGVAATEVDVEAGAETMTYQSTRGQAVIDALRECEATEGGVLFDGTDGDLKLHNRAHRYTAAAAATLNMAAQHVGADYAPRLDRTRLVNDVTVDNPTTGEAARAADTSSSDEYGFATTSASSFTESSESLRQKAAWTIAAYSEPRMRVPTLTVDVLAHQGLTPSAQTLLGVTVGDVLAVTNAPTQADTASPSYFVEGYTEAIAPESYSITFNLSPTYPTLDVLVLDDATRGKLDTGLLAY